MLFKKEGFPEDGELVLCTVTSVQFHSVFVDMDEYGKNGMIHISEVSPGRIRNIRDFVREGKKIVCKVLKINREKGYIDLSLRRVNEKEKRRKIDQIKRGQNSEKIIEIAAQKVGLKTEDFYKLVSEKISGKYETLFDFFEAVVKNDKAMSELDLDKKQAQVLSETIKLRVKPAEVEIKGKMKIMTFAPNGIDIVKESLQKAEDSGKGSLEIIYLGSGQFRFSVKAPDYKEAEKILKTATDVTINFVSKHSGTAEFARDAS